MAIETMTHCETSSITSSGWIDDRRYKRILTAQYGPKVGHRVGSGAPEECKLVAVHDGCGESATWNLCVEDSTGQVVAYLEWPKKWPPTMTRDELHAAGFECVPA